MPKKPSIPEQPRQAREKAAASAAIGGDPRSRELIQRFFHRLRQASRSILFLDYDGTLAPFRVDPREAVPYPGVTDLLRQISQRENRTKVVIVSGRPAEEVQKLLGLEGIEIWGSHGWELLNNDGRIRRFQLPHGTARRLREAERMARQFGYADRVERKHASVALHWRGLDEAAQKKMLEKIAPRWRELAEETGLRMVAFDGGIELRDDSYHKGTAVQMTLERVGSDALPAYLGDDATDEDGFRVVRPRGLSVLVREQYRETVAEAWIRPPEELLAFLQRWLGVTGGAE